LSEDTLPLKKAPLRLFLSVLPIYTAMFLPFPVMAAQAVNFVACGQVGFPRGLLPVAGEAVPH
jgi:hypothetical protein